jgi:hypothetical protein
LYYHSDIKFYLITFQESQDKCGSSAYHAKELYMDYGKIWDTTNHKIDNKAAIVTQFGCRACFVSSMQPALNVLWLGFLIIVQYMMIHIFCI